MVDSKGTRKRNNLRQRLACARCQRRKIRCDGQVPTCSNCRKASVECNDGNSLRLGDVPREKISRLTSRVHWLESIIRTRCPDVDLSQTELDDVPDAREVSTQLYDESQRSESISSHEPPRPPEANGLLSHEIGLVSLNSSQDPRYIGPSSGYFLARLMLASKSRHEAPSLAEDLVDALQGPLPFPPLEQTRALCYHYFDAVHYQFPILHQPTFMNSLPDVLDSLDPEPEDAFQVFMVLAIGATIASHRRRVHLPAESYCLSALQYLEQLNAENSVKGLQSLLLLQIFTFHCPNMKLNVWYLNYHCIASVLDLGLQRDIRTSSGITLLEQELRTRIFWTVLMMDRRIATMMGRPIGLRDEACDLRLPKGIEDDVLTSQHPIETRSGPMAFSLHLFKLTRLNSEIKYVANSIVRKTPEYAFPAMRSLPVWHEDMLNRLDQWAVDLPPRTPSTSFLHTTSLIRYHNLQMVLLRPSPAIPQPSPESLQKCYTAACNNLQLFKQLYGDNLLIHTWDTFHSIVLSAITMLYCIKAVPELGRANLEDLASDMGSYLGILSATGEHWQGAKRCRDILEDLTRNLVRWLRDRRVEVKAPEPDAMQVMITPEDMGLQNFSNLDMPAFSQPDPAISFENFDSFMGSTLSLDACQSADFDDVDAFMRNLFDDFIPNGAPFG